jgi:hypothetical protein
VDFDCVQDIGTVLNTNSEVCTALGSSFLDLGSLGKLVITFYTIARILRISKQP